MKKPARAKMSPDEIKHFLVSYDLATDKTEVESFGTDYDAAQAAYAEAEQANAERRKARHRSPERRLAGDDQTDSFELLQRRHPPP